MLIKGTKNKKKVLKIKNKHLCIPNFKKMRLGDNPGTPSKKIKIYEVQEII